MNAVFCYEINFVVNPDDSPLGGILLYDCLSNTPLLSSSLSLIAKVLLLKPFRVFLIKYMFEIMAKNIILFIYLFASKNT